MNVPFARTVFWADRDLEHFSEWSPVSEDQGALLNPKGVINVAPTIVLRRGDIYDAQLLDQWANLLESGLGRFGF